MTTLKTIGLMLLFLALAALILITVSLVADRLAEASRGDEYNIVIGSTYGEVGR